MTGLLIDHLWQSTLVVLIAALLAFMLRHEAAKWRFRIWFAASIKFLVPFSLLFALGSGMSSKTSAVRELSPVWRETVIQWVQPMAQRERSDTTSLPMPRGESPAIDGTVPAESATSPAPAIEPAAPSARALTGAAAPTSESGSNAGTSAAAVSVLSILAAIWILGFFVIAACWFRRWRSLRLIMRSAHPVELAVARELGLAARVTQAPIEPGVFGIRRPVLLLPRGLTDRLTPGELQAIVCHEHAHVVRRDNLTALMHMLVEALFWFHPFVWWIGRRLLDERETACDEAVLQSGMSPLHYASGILRVCEINAPPALACAAGVRGGSLESRVARITQNAPVPGLSRARAFVLFIVPVAVLITPIAIGMLTLPPAEAQQAPPTAQAAETYNLWYPLDGPPPLINGFGGSADAGADVWSDFYFSMDLFQCQVMPDDVTDDSDVDLLPNIRDFRSLVAFAYDLDTDLIVWPERAGTTSLRVRDSFRDEPGLAADFEREWLVRLLNREAEVFADSGNRIEACRELIRAALEDGYELRMRREGGRYFVDNFDEPEPPLPRHAAGRPELVVSHETLDGYAGYYYGVPDIPFDFTPVIRVWRDDDNLVLDWNGTSYPLYPSIGRSFSTNRFMERVQRRSDGPVVGLNFAFDDELGWVANTGRAAPASVPEMRAIPLDAAIAEAWLADIDRRARATVPMAGSREIVDEMAARLESGEFGDASATARAATELVAALELTRPGAFAGRGALRDVLLRNVDRAGRDRYEIIYDRLTIEVTVVPAGPDAIASLAIAARCPMSDSRGSMRERACMIPVAVDIGPSAVADTAQAADQAWPTGRNQLLQRMVNLRIWGSAEGTYAADMEFRLSLEGCDPVGPAIAEAAPERYERAPEFSSFADVVGYAYDLEPIELQWPEAIAMPPLQRGRYNGYVDKEHCAGFLRQALRDELGLAAHFERVLLPVWQLSSAAESFSLDPSAEDRPARISVGNGTLQGNNASMSDLVRGLSSRLGTPVFDRTGITESFDLFLSWEPVPRGEPSGIGVERMRQSLAEIGLVLATIEAPIDRLVVDAFTAPPAPEPRTLRRVQ